jgi:hypothetical protein
MAPKAKGKADAGPPPASLLDKLFPLWADPVAAPPAKGPVGVHHEMYEDFTSI